MKRLKEEWTQYGSDFYCVRRLYDCDPSKIIEDGVVECPYGGLFLRCRDSPTFLDVFSNTGGKIVSRNFEFISDVCAVFWCSGGRIGLVRQNGEIVVSYLSGEVIRRFKPVVKSSVEFAYPFMNGIAVVTRSKAFCVFDFIVSEYEIYHKIESKERVSAICFVRGGYERGFVVLCDGSVLCIQKGSSRVITCLDFVPTQLRVSPNCVNMAACSKEISCVFPCEIKGNVKSLKFFCSSFAWLGDDSFVLVGDKSKVLFMQLPNVRQTIGGDLTAEKVIQDEGFVRIISKSGLYLIQKIPQELLRITDDKSVSLLLQARELTKQGSEQAYSKYKEVDNETIERILSAVFHCIDPNHQEQLLALAAWGHNSPKYLETLNETRMFNTLRTSEFGFAAPPSARSVSSPMHIIDLLLQLGFFDCASKLCSLFGFSQNSVAETWALEMIDRHGEKALPKVLERLDADPSFTDFTRIARSSLKYHISQKGLLELAARIRNAKDRILFKLNLPGVDVVNEALESLDGNAIFTALYHSMLTLSVDDFRRILERNRDAFCCFAIWKKQKNVRELCRIQGFPRHFVTEHLLVHEVLSSKRLYEDQILVVQEVPPQTSPFQECLTNQIQLLHILGDKEAIKAIGARSTPREFASACIMANDKETAKKICQLYHISSRTYSIIVAQTYAKNRRWTDFETFTLKGDLPLDICEEVCRTYGNKVLAAQISERIAAAEKKRTPRLRFLGK